MRTSAELTVTVHVTALNDRVAKRLQGILAAIEEQEAEAEIRIGLPSTDGGSGIGPAELGRFFGSLAPVADVSAAAETSATHARAPAFGETVDLEFEY